MFTSNTKRLTDYEYNNAVIQRILGNTYKSISETIDGDHSHKYLQKLISTSVELDVFNLDGDTLSINTIDDEVTAVVIPGYFKSNNIKLTHDLADGILICSNHIDYNGTDSHSVNDFSVSDDKWFRVGFIIEFCSQSSTLIDYIKHIRYLTQQPSKLLPPALECAGFSYSTVDDLIWSDQDKLATVKYVTDITYVEEPLPELVEKQYTWQGSNKALLIDDGDETFSCDSTHDQFSNALKLAIDGQFEEAIALINTRKAVQEYTRGYVEIKNGILRYKGIPIYSGIATRIIESMRLGEDFERYIPFFEKLMENPSRRAVLRLFDFLTANDIEITDDGDIIAWKVITHNWKDCHTQTFDNSITGIPVTMPRNLVNDDDTETCSEGLHACSRSYIKSFKSSSNRIVKVLINPKDVVSIPIDYNDAKMRVCSYIVLEEVEQDE